jgi:hypothetical protein
MEDGLSAWKCTSSNRRRDALNRRGLKRASGALEIRMGRDTTFGETIDAVELAEKSRTPIQGIADRLAGYLVYFALGAAD